MSYLVFSISLLLYAALIIGIVFVFEPAIKSLISLLTIKRREELSRNKEPEIIALLSKLVFSSTGKEKKGKFLLALEIFIGTFVFFLAHIFYTTFTSLVIALLTASVPLLSLVSKTQKIRNRSSLEGPSFIAEFYRQYRMGDLNVFSAMERVAQNEKDFPLCARQTYLLLLRLRASGNADAIDSACRDFAFAIGTSWGKTLSSCIRSACKGTDISEALVDILQCLKIAKEEQEEKKRLNSEALRMTVFLVPMMYFATVILAINYLGQDMLKFFKNQFCTPEGVLLFFMIAFLFFANIVILDFVSNGKSDL